MLVREAEKGFCEEDWEAKGAHFAGFTVSDEEDVVFEALLSLFDLVFDGELDVEEGEEYGDVFPLVEEVLSVLTTCSEIPVEVFPEVSGELPEGGNGLGDCVFITLRFYWYVVCLGGVHIYFRAPLVLSCKQYEA